MGTWKTRGLRGSGLEELLNLSNEIYRNSQIALIQKIPTPITPMEIDRSSRHITLAYFDKQSTVDYIGVVQSIPVCFDAKECASDCFPLANIHAHQMQFMKEFEEQRGIAFLIISFTKRDELYFLPYRSLMRYWRRMEAGGRKSFTYDEMDRRFPIRRSREVPAHYLEQLEAYLELSEELEQPDELPAD
ncbi:recombination protein U [Moryella indoligenes]|uniref:Holliday junction resolvase RecU n=1 Tax=Moryella indoligenes TaxID=371674 RepID=A0AAE3VBZ4_9FIRM|nr:Holliday junction resolvase RecU [Moryella indoligenes]MDQ0153322.1 recombination protein U [Moryella indoligenes]